MVTLRTCHRRQTGKASPNHHAQSSPILLSPSPPFSLLHLSFLLPFPRFFLGVDKRRRHHQIATLKASQRRQTEMASPNAYAGNPPAQANRDDTTKWLRSAALTVAKRRWRHSLATLGTRQRSQAEETPPNRYAERPSAQSARDSITKSLRSESLSVARRGKHHQMSTLRTAQHRVIRPRATPNTGRQTQGHPTQTAKHRSSDPRPSNTGPPNAHPKQRIPTPHLRESPHRDGNGTGRTELTPCAKAST